MIFMTINFRFPSREVSKLNKIVSDGKILTKLTMCISFTGTR